MTDIQKFENWTEVSRGYYRYVVAANACYELMAIQQGATTGPDYYALYVTGEWKDPNGVPYFKRECLQSCETMANCLYIAQKDYDANRDILWENPEFEVTVEDVATIQNFISKDDSKIEFNEMKAMAKVLLEMYLKVMEKKGEQK